MKNSKAVAAAVTHLRGVDVNIKKLALWDCSTFKPICTHDELEFILAPLGIFPLFPSPPLPSAQSQPSSKGGGEPAPPVHNRQAPKEVEGEGKPPPPAQSQPSPKVGGGGGELPPPAKEGEGGEPPPPAQSQKSPKEGKGGVEPPPPPQTQKSPKEGEGGGEPPPPPQTQKSPKEGDGGEEPPQTQKSPKEGEGGGEPPPPAQTQKYPKEGEDGGVPPPPPQTQKSPEGGEGGGKPPPPAQTQKSPKEGEGGGEPPSAQSQQSPEEVEGGGKPPPPAQSQQLPEGGEPLGGEVVWREYTSTTVWPGMKGSRCLSPLPPPRLPYPRIDGLHLKVYRAFLITLEFYLGPAIYNHFHIRGMSLNAKVDQEFDSVYRHMDDVRLKDGGILLYRGNTLDDLTEATCSLYEEGDLTCRHIKAEHGMEKSDSITENPTIPTSLLVQLKKLFPSRYPASPS